MVARLRTLQARVLPRGWLDLLRQVVLVGVAYGAYSLVRGLVEGDTTEAFQHARDLIGVERSLHVFVEPSVQAWASSSHLLMDFSSWLYVNAQTSITLAARTPNWVLRCFIASLILGSPRLLFST